MDTSNLSVIPSEVIRNVLCETIEEQLKSKSFKVTVNSASKVGENNFLGIVYRILFKNNDPLDSKYQKSSLIAKIAPQNVAKRDYLFSEVVFLQEMYMYEEVLPFLHQFEQSKGVIGENGFSEHPQCYRTVKKEFNECLLLEDLSVRNFRMIDKYTEAVTADHVNLVLKALAKFHAISFALRDQQPEKFLKFASKLKETFISEENIHLHDYFDGMKARIRGILLKVEADEHLITKIETLFERPAIKILTDCLSKQYETAILHGDVWQNNTLFRYDDKGIPIEVNLIDWQVCRNASPVLDVLYFLFGCTTKELRDDHYEDFLNVYHEQLSNHIQRLGSDPEKLFSYSTMLEHLHKFGKFALIMTTMILPCIMADKGLDLDEIANNAEEYKDVNEVDYAFFTSDISRKKFYERLRDVVVDMVRLEYI